MTKRARKHAAAMALAQRLADAGAWKLSTDWSLLLDIVNDARELVDLPRSIEAAASGQKAS